MDLRMRKGCVYALPCWSRPPLMLPQHGMYVCALPCRAAMLPHLCAYSSPSTSSSISTSRLVTACRWPCMEGRESQQVKEMHRCLDSSPEP